MTVSEASLVECAVWIPEFASPEMNRFTGQCDQNEVISVRAMAPEQRSDRWDDRRLANLFVIAEQGWQRLLHRSRPVANRRGN